MARDFPYWKNRLEQAPRDEVVKEIRDTLDGGDLTVAAYAFLAVVESMSKTDIRALRSYMIKIMEHLYLLELIPKDSEDYRRNEQHWFSEIDGWRMDIRQLLDDEPSLVSCLESIFRSQRARAKISVINHMYRYGLTIDPKLLRELSLEEVYSVEQA